MRGAGLHPAHADFLGLDGSPYAPLQQVSELVDERQEEALLVGEVKVDSTLGCTGNRYNLVHAGVVVALAGKFLQGGIENSPFRPARITL